METRDFENELRIRYVVATILDKGNPIAKAKMFKKHKMRIETDIERFILKNISEISRPNFSNGEIEFELEFMRHTDLPIITFNPRDYRFYSNDLVQCDKIYSMMIILLYRSSFKRELLSEYIDYLRDQQVENNILIF